MQDRESARPRRAAEDKGIALLAVLAVVAILAVVIMDFSFSVRVDLHVAANFRDRLVALQAAKAGVNLGIYMLRQDEPGRDTLQEPWAELTVKALETADPAEFEDLARMAEEEADLYKHEDFLDRQEEGNVPSVTTVIYDEERKINVNLLAQPRTRSLCREWIETLIENMELPEVVPYEIVDSITDWVDQDDDGDAEQSYYERLPQPYSCRNDEMESIYELKMVKGITDLLFFGDTPYPMQLSGQEEEKWDERERLGYTMPDLAPWERQEDPLAIYGLVNFLTANSAGTINILTAPREVLLAILDNNDFLVDTILDIREKDPTLTREINQVILQISPTLHKTLVSGGLTTFGSTYFRIEATGKFHRSAVKVTAIVSRNRTRDITVYSWRVEDVRPEEASEGVAWANAI